MSQKNVNKLIVKIKFKDGIVKRVKIPQSKNTKDEDMITFLEKQCNVVLDTDDFTMFYEIDEDIDIETFEVEEIGEEEETLEEVTYRLDNILDTLNIISNNNSNENNNEALVESMELNLKGNSNLLDVVNEINEKLEIIDEVVDENGDVIIKTKTSAFNITLNIINIIMLFGLMILAILI